MAEEKVREVKGPGPTTKITINNHRLNKAECQNPRSKIPESS